MDHLGFMGLAAFGCICWVLGARRKLSPLWVKAGVAPACFILVVSFLLMLFRSQPVFWTGEAELNPFIVFLIALGVYAVIAERKPKKENGHGGAQSA